MQGQVVTTLKLKPRGNFVSTDQVHVIAQRALFYLKAGYPVHFSGPAGTGKTTLALHVAACLGRPVVLIHGDDEFSSSDLAGSNQGYRKSKIVDNFIHSVLKTEETLQRNWLDSRLTHACKLGLTLLYDEFTRSRPEANNVLLSILEERVLDLPGGVLAHGRGGQAQVAGAGPDRGADRTGNPERCRASVTDGKPKLIFCVMETDDAVPLGDPGDEVAGLLHHDTGLLEAHQMIAVVSQQAAVVEQLQIARQVR